MISHSDLLLNAISYRSNENPYELDENVWLGYERDEEVPPSSHGGQR